MGVDLTLKGSALPADLAAEKKDIPAGVDPFELEDLAKRLKRLAVLGRAIKEGRNVNTIWDDPTPFASSDACTGSAASHS